MEAYPLQQVARVKPIEMKANRVRTVQKCLRRAGVILALGPVALLVLSILSATVSVLPWCRRRELEDVARAADVQLRAEAESARKTLELVKQSFPADSSIGQSVRVLLDERVAAAENIADLVAARAAMVRIEADEETILHAQLLAELEEQGE